MYYSENDYGKMDRNKLYCQGFERQFVKKKAEQLKKIMKFAQRVLLFSPEYTKMIK